jgi:hypothetical protein
LGQPAIWIVNLHAVSSIEVGTKDNKVSPAPCRSDGTKIPLYRAVMAISDNNQDTGVLPSIRAIFRHIPACCHTVFPQQ